MGWIWYKVVWRRFRCRGRTASRRPWLFRLLQVPVTIIILLTLSKNGNPPSLPRRELAAGVVDGVLPLQDKLREGHHRVPLLYHPLQYPRQGLRGVEGGVVEQHDAPRPHLGRDPPENGVSVVVLPVQTIPNPHTGKRPWEAALGRFATPHPPEGARRKARTGIVQQRLQAICQGQLYPMSKA